MNKILALLLLAILPHTILAGGVHSADQKDIRVGISTRAFFNVQHNDAVAAFRTWASVLIREQGLQHQVEMTLFNQPAEICQAFKQGQLQAASLVTDEFKQLGFTPDTVYLPAREDGFHTTYAILVHRDGTIKELDDLPGRTLTVHEGYGMALSPYWLRALFADQPNADRWLSQLATVDKPSQGILQVFFRQSDAVLVSLEAFELACQLNPQLRKHLRVLTQSPKLIPALFLFHPSYQGTSRDKMEAAISRLHHTPAGKQVLTTFQSSRLERHPVSVLQETLDFLVRHQSPGSIPPRSGGRP